MYREKIEFAALSMAHYRASKSPSRTVINSGPKIISDPKGEKKRTTLLVPLFPIVLQPIRIICVTTISTFSFLFSFLLQSPLIDRIDVSRVRTLEERVYSRYRIIDRQHSRLASVFFIFHWNHVGIATITNESQV